MCLPLRNSVLLCSDTRFHSCWNKALGFTVDRKVKYNTFAHTSIHTSKETARFDPLPGVPIDRMPVVLFVYNFSERNVLHGASPILVPNSD